MHFPLIVPIIIGIFLAAYDVQTTTQVKLFYITIRKAVQLQAWSGPEGSRKLRFPHFMTTAQDDGKVIYK